jgi:hypothetical protein
MYYQGDVYRLGKGFPLPYFLDRIEAKCKDVSIFVAASDESADVDVSVVVGQCLETELVLSHLDSSLDIQLSWAVRWRFAKCKKWRVRKDYGLSLEELD